MGKQAGIIVIGNEVLSGKVEDINSTFLLRELRELGVEVARVSVIPDLHDVIGDQVREFSSLFDHVFTTGGVGPTHDDITFTAIADAFDMPIERNAELERVIREFFGDQLEDSHLDMALVPTGTELVWSDGLPFPATRVGNVWIMPGDPEVMRRKFKGIRERFREAPIYLRRIYTTLGEGRLSRLMEEIENDLDGVQIGSYPVYGHSDFEVQITIESRDESVVSRAEERFRDEIPPESIWKII